MVIEREPIVTGSTGEPDNSRLRPLLDVLKSRRIEQFEVDSQNPNGAEAAINEIYEPILESVDQGDEIDDLAKLIRQAEIEVVLAVISNRKEKFSRRREFMAKVDPETIRRDRAVFRSVAKVAKEAGLAVQLRLGELDLIVSYLEVNEIPVGRAQFEVQSGEKKGQILRYRVISVADEEVARQKLGNPEEAAFANMRKS